MLHAIMLATAIQTPFYTHRRLPFRHTGHRLVAPPFEHPPMLHRTSPHVSHFIIFPPPFLQVGQGLLLLKLGIWTTSLLKLNTQ